jgi:hypothetical protein
MVIDTPIAKGHQEGVRAYPISRLHLPRLWPTTVVIDIRETLHSLTVNTTMMTVLTTGTILRIARLFNHSVPAVRTRRLAIYT